jgi:hypothetical protein
MKEVFSCRECFGNLLKELGEGLMRLLSYEEEEKDKGNGT